MASRSHNRCRWRGPGRRWMANTSKPVCGGCDRDAFGIPSPVRVSDRDIVAEPHGIFLVFNAEDCIMVVMMHWIRQIISCVLASACLVAPAHAQPVTTIITHGFSAGSKGVWVQGMAEAILARAPGGGAAGHGSCYRYNESTGLWNFVATTHGDGSPDVIVLIFNWQPESASVSAGPNWNYVQAAADALYGALRDAHFGNPPGTGIPPRDLVSNRKVHFIAHSRGCPLNSEAVRRLARAGIPVDQVTTLDPHPVNGILDPPYNYNWGDPTVVKWTNVAWADNYWRADGGGIIAGLNFDGMPLNDAFNTQLSETALNNGGYSQSHSDVHLWYHGTID